MLSIEITMSKTPEEILELIRKTHRGPKGISDLLGGQITPQAVSQWKRVPPAWCIPLEEKTGVSRHEMRPDIFGKSEVAA
jgi:hypothetical protein